jgi:hypothetical protein
MMMSQRFKASMLKASCSVVSFLAWAGALPPALDVEKKHGFDQVEIALGCMRSIRTEPTMPRQPTSPTNLPIQRPFNVKNNGTQKFSARLVWPGGRTTNRAVSALNGCRFGGRRAHGLLRQPTPCSKEWAGGKHGCIVAKRKAPRGLKYF